MAQERLWNFKEEDSTELLNRRELGFFAPGRYRGFDYGTPAGPLILHLIQTATGFRYIDKDLNTHANLGLLKTTQGVVIMETAAVDLPISATTTQPRIDLVVFEHEFVEVEGGQEGIYLIKQGTPGPSPVAPVLDSPTKQIIIGQIYLPAGCSNIATTSGVVYTPAPVPLVSADPNIVYTNIEQVITKMKTMQAIKFATGIAEISTGSDSLLFDQKANQWILLDAGLTTYEAAKVRTIVPGFPVTAGYRLRVFTMQALKFVATDNIAMEWATDINEKVIYIPAGTWFELESLNGFTPDDGLYPAAQPKWGVSLGADAKTYLPNKFTKRQVWAKGLNAPTYANVGENSVMTVDNTGNFYDLNLTALTFVGGINGSTFQEALSTKFKAGGILFFRVNLTTDAATFTIVHNSPDFGSTKPITCPGGTNLAFEDGDIVMLLEDETHWRVAGLMGSNIFNLPAILAIIRNNEHVFTKMQTWGLGTDNTHATHVGNKIRILNKVGNTYIVEINGDAEIWDIVHWTGSSEVAIPAGTEITLKLLYGDDPTPTILVTGGTDSKILVPWKTSGAPTEQRFTLNHGEVFVFKKLTGTDWEIQDCPGTLFDLKADRLEANWRELGAVGQPAITGPVSNSGSSPAGFRKDNFKNVHFRGRLVVPDSTPTVVHPIFSLPTGYRPPFVMTFACPCMYGSEDVSFDMCLVRFKPDGGVQLTHGLAVPWPNASVVVDMSAIRFRID